MVFPVSRGPLSSLAHGPPSPFWPSRGASSWPSLLSLLYPHLLLWLSSSSLIWTLVMTMAYLNNPSIPNLNITFTKFHWPSEITVNQVQGLRDKQEMWGARTCAIYIIHIIQRPEKYFFAGPLEEVFWSLKIDYGYPRKYRVKSWGPGPSKRRNQKGPWLHQLRGAKPKANMALCLCWASPWQPCQHGSSRDTEMPKVRGLCLYCCGPGHSHL